MRGSDGQLTYPTREQALTARLARHIQGFRVVYVETKYERCIFAKKKTRLPKQKGEQEITAKSGKVDAVPQDIRCSPQLMPHVCRIPKPNNCERCACIPDPADPKQQVCVWCAFGYYQVSGSLSKYAICIESLGFKLARPNWAANHSYLYVYFVYGMLFCPNISSSFFPFLQVFDFQTHKTVQMTVPLHPFEKR
jgi:hypothetical protein